LIDARKEAPAQLCEEKPSARQASLQGTKSWINEALK